MHAQGRCLEKEHKNAWKKVRGRDKRDYFKGQVAPTMQLKSIMHLKRRLK